MIKNVVSKYINEVSKFSYDIAWDETYDKNISKWEKKYNIKIVPGNFDDANVSGNDKKKLKLFFTKEMNFEEPEFELINF